jgi:hypothetical protein
MRYSACKNFITTVGNETSRRAVNLTRWHLSLVQNELQMKNTSISSSAFSGDSKPLMQTKTVVMQIYSVLVEKYEPYTINYD